MAAFRPSATGECHLCSERENPSYPAFRSPGACRRWEIPCSTGRIVGEDSEFSRRELGASRTAENCPLAEAAYRMADRIITDEAQATEQVPARKYWAN